MATSAIGPGFLTQTALFTQELLASFGFVILVSILLDIGAQLNIWRVVTVSGSRAQDLANKILPGLGYFLAGLVAFGGLVFNIGNIAGCGLGLNVLSGLDPAIGAIISCIIALGIFWYREAGHLLDHITRILGIIMIGLTIYIAIIAAPPVGEALYRTVWPEKISLITIVTIVGGTVGGYISFAGAHRLLDAGIKGRSFIPQVTRSSVNGILLTSIMRFVLFLGALGVVWHGATLDKSNPAASVFRFAAGNASYIFFGVVMWSAAITSVLGASYTSVSFWKTLHPIIAKNEKWVVSGFIIISTIIFVILGNPVRLLVFAGALNGMILPLALAIVLVAARKPNLVLGYRHPLILQLIGWIVVAAMSWMGWMVLRNLW